MFIISSVFSQYLPHFLNMAHFFVCVYEGQKNIIGQQIIKVAEGTCTFGEIYEAVTEGIFGERDVKVYAGKEASKWYL